MNTAGLFFDGTRTPNAPYPDNDSKPDCHCYLWTKILQDCDTVDQAIALVQKYKVPDLEVIHIIFADKLGQSAIVGMYNGELKVPKRTGSL